MDTLQSGQDHPSIWTESFLVRTFESDMTGHLSFFYLCNYLQEVAGNHARGLGVSIEFLQERQLTWMLSRFHVQMARFPAIGETLIIKSWPAGVGGLHGIREFQLFSEGGEHIGKATSGWLMIDLNRYRPIRMPEFITSIELPDIPRAIDDSFSKLPSPDAQDTGHARAVGYQDVDINQHANSMRYIAWALEDIPFELRQAHQLIGLEAQFRAEARYGEPVTSRMSGEEEALSYRHGLYAQASGKELAVVRSRWAKTS